MGTIWEPHPEEGNPIFDELMERTNTKIDFRFYPGTNYQEKVSTVLASDDIPDVIYGANTANLIDQGAIIPLDALLEEHGSNILRHLEKSDYPYLRQAIDGQIYNLPFILNSLPPYSMQIREDWLANVNIDKVPETWDEWIDTWKAFRDEDANGDGDPTNEVPYVGDVYSLLPSFGINVGNKIGFVEDADGNYTLMYELPEFRQYLEAMQTLYKDGLLDKEFATRGTYIDHDKLKEAMMSDIGGSCMSWANYTRDVTETMRETKPDAKLIGVKPIKGPDGKSGKQDSAPLSAVASITIGAEDKAEDIMRFFDYVFSDEGILLMSFGIEGVHHEIVDSEPVLKKPYNQTFVDAREAGLNFTPFPHLFSKDAFFQITFAGKTYEEASDDARLFYDASIIGEEDLFTVLPTLNTEAYTEKQAQIFPKLEGLLAQCVTGDLSVEQFYEEYEKLKPVGLQDILDQGNEAWKLVSEQ